MERDTALLAEQAGEATNAMVRWGLAAQAAGDVLERLQALAAARRQAELAFHQAVRRCGHALNATPGARLLRWSASRGRRSTADIASRRSGSLAPVSPWTSMAAWARRPGTTADGWRRR